LLPLSGGADSSSTAAIVGSMCQIVCKAIEDQATNSITSTNEVEAECRRICKFTAEESISPTKMANALFSTVYLGTDNSSEDTRKRAKDLAEEVGAKHLSCSIDTVVAAIVAFFAVVTGKTPKFKLFGGTNAENLAMQNIQARVRMVLAFLFAQLLPWVRGQNGGFLLVLGSANVDEGLRGYLTKYDCSSADINPIGGISKVDLKKFLVWGATHLGYPTLAEVEQAPPTAELEPITKEYIQCDEVDMGMTYDELGTYGRLRKIEKLGPVSMFRRLCGEWSSADPSANRQALKPREVAEKVKKFFFYYSLNRHKMTTITPTYHAENYSPDDNRFDLRPFLYNVKWPWQFQRIDAMVAKAEAM
jgi:NAD+ synthase (glutamine-hydrolysing)